MDCTRFAIDAGVIRCICGFDDDDGFTIQCEKCNAWQHGQCVDIYRDAEVPDTYYCSVCSDRKVNVQAAIQRQLKRREKEASEGKKRKPSKSVKFRNGVDLSIKTGTHNNIKAAAPKTPGTPKIENITIPDGLEKSALSRKKKKRLTVQESQFEGPSREGSDSDTDVEFFTATKSPDGKESNSASVKSYKRFRDAYKIYHVHSNTSVYTNRIVKEEIDKLLTADLDDQICSNFTSQEYERTQAVRVMVRPTSNSASSNKFKFGGFSEFGLYTHPDGFSVSRGRYITELNGELLLRSQYKSEPLNQYRFFGCPKPGVLFIPGLDIAVDGRRIGNEGVFLRPNCKTPNARISTVIVAGEKVRFALFASDIVRPGEELTVPWEFDPKHPIQKILREDMNLSDAEKFCLLETRNTILQRGMQCACRSQDCILAVLKNIQNENEVISVVPETSIPMIPGFSAREQRKLRGALSLIDKMSIQTSKKRKRESLAIMAHRPQKAKMDFSESESDLESQEPAIYPLSFKQQTRQKFLIAKVDLERPRPPTMNEKEFDVSPISSRSTSPIPSPTLQARANFPLTKALSILSAVPKTPVATKTVAAATPIAVEAPKQVKKLSFADYIKSKRK